MGAAQAQLGDPSDLKSEEMDVSEMYEYGGLWVLVLYDRAL